MLWENRLYYFRYSSVLLSFTIVAQDNSTESVLRGTSSTINIVNPAGWVYESPAAVLYDNGAYFNSPGGGPGEQMAVY